MHQHNAGWVSWVGELPTRKGGAMISDRDGTSTGYALGNLQERGEMFIGAGEAVYEGMIVGENSRSDDMMINIIREKQKTNIRTHSADEAIKLVPPREVTLENAIEFIGDDELVEITPQSLRLRKRMLKEADRRRTNKK
jgi:GTP-binding protein